MQKNEYTYMYIEHRISFIQHAKLRHVYWVVGYTLSMYTYTYSLYPRKRGRYREPNTGGVRLQIPPNKRW